MLCKKCQVHFANIFNLSFHLQIDFLPSICYNNNMANRIDRIDGNKYYEYTKVKSDKVPDTDEKFSLEYKRRETTQTSGEKKEQEREVSEEKQKERVERNGVRLELSAPGQRAGTAPRQTAAKAGAQTKTDLSSMLETVRTFFETAVSAIKDFFYKIWNEPEDASTQAAGAEETAEGQPADFQTALDTAAAEASIETSDSLAVTPQADSPEAAKAHELRLDSQIQPYLRNGDLNQVISLLTDNGQKTIARNSTLLTYYDKTGKMVEPNASDRERILNGDRHARKL